jgi:Acetyltransferase (GNAT) domain
VIRACWQGPGSRPASGAVHVIATECARTVGYMHPESARLTFREMTPDDLDDIALLLGDPDVMTYYPRPKTRDEAAYWI